MINSRLYVWRIDENRLEPMLFLGIHRIEKNYSKDGLVTFSELISTGEIPYLVRWPAYSRYEIVYIDNGRPDNPGNALTIMRLHRCSAVRYWVDKVIPLSASDTTELVAYLDVQCDIEWIENASQPVHN